jgi:hypothetical protein
MKRCAFCGLRLPWKVSLKSARFKNEATKWNSDPRTANANTADDRNELRSVDRGVDA